MNRAVSGQNETVSLSSRTASTPSAQMTLERAARTANALLMVLERLIPIARRVATGVRVLAWSCFVAVGVMAVALVVANPPHTAPPVILLLAFVAAFAVPGFILLLFHGALVEVLALPAWLRTSPELARTHGTELAKLAGWSAVPGGPGTPRGRTRGRFLRDSFRSGKLLLEAHGDLPEYGSMLRLVSVPFLLAVAIAFGVVLFEWALATMMVLVTIVTLLVG